MTLSSSLNARLGTNASFASPSFKGYIRLNYNTHADSYLQPNIRILLDFLQMGTGFINLQKIQSNYVGQGTEHDMTPTSLSLSTALRNYLSIITSTVESSIFSKYNLINAGLHKIHSLITPLKQHIYLTSRIFTPSYPLHSVLDNMYIYIQQSPDDILAATLTLGCTPLFDWIASWIGLKTHSDSEQEDSTTESLLMSFNSMNYLVENEYFKSVELDWSDFECSNLLNVR
jgi:hypothetical protein